MTWKSKGEIDHYRFEDDKGLLCRILYDKMKTGMSRSKLK